MMVVPSPAAVVPAVMTAVMTAVVVAKATPVMTTAKAAPVVPAPAETSAVWHLPSVPKKNNP